MMSREARGTISLLSPRKSWSSLSPQAAGEPGASVTSTEQISCKTRGNHDLCLVSHVRDFQWPSQTVQKGTGYQEWPISGNSGLNTFLLDINLLPLTHEGSVGFYGPINGLARVYRDSCTKTGVCHETRCPRARCGYRVVPETWKLKIYECPLPPSHLRSKELSSRKFKVSGYSFGSVKVETLVGMGWNTLPNVD